MAKSKHERDEWETEEKLNSSEHPRGEGGIKGPWLIFNSEHI